MLELGEAGCARGCGFLLGFERATLIVRNLEVLGLFVGSKPVVFTHSGGSLRGGIQCVYFGIVSNLTY